MDYVKTRDNTDKHNTTKHITSFDGGNKSGLQPYGNDFNPSLQMSRVL